MTTSPTLLIFPSNIDSAHKFAKTAYSMGFKLIGANSTGEKSKIPHLSDSFLLPFVTEPNFQKSLSDALSKFQVTHIYTPHSVVWWHLNQLVQETSIDITLCASHPYDENWHEYSSSWQWAENQHQSPLERSLPRHGSVNRPKLGIAQLAGLHKSFTNIPGETDENKLSALCEIVKIAPPGDVIEIGSLYGRSAFALSWLSSHYQVGSTICIDPWDMKKTTDQGEAANMVLQSGLRIDMESIFKCFLCTIAPLPSTSYIRETSANAIEVYEEASKKKHLKAEFIQPIPISGKIALLHIDGNHRYDHVRRDIDLWTPHLALGGWLLLDDYVWTFGDGPRLAGDELLSSGLYDHAFTLSDTLFLRRNLELKRS